jgi:hypothetical protein
MAIHQDVDAVELLVTSFDGSHPRLRRPQVRREMVDPQPSGPHRRHRQRMIATLDHQLRGALADPPTDEQKTPRSSHARARLSRPDV